MGLRTIILGPPGAGKGTQAKRIAQVCEVPHISTGDIFREHVARGTNLGEEVAEYLDAGKLVPDELTWDVVEDRLEQKDCRAGFILDGFPRSAPQAELLDGYLSDRDQALDAVIDIEIPDSEIVERLSARRVCPKCGAIYNLKFDPPQGDPEHCDRRGCRGRLVQRDDDNEATIRQRLRVYHKTTKPMVEYYRKKGILKSIAASGLAPTQLFADIQAALGAHQTGQQT